MTRSSLSFAAIVLVLSIGCAANQGGRTPIPAPSQSSDYQPPNALTPRDTGLLGRSVFRTIESDPYRVEFEDVLVQPSSSPIALPLSQAAVIEVRSGEGNAAVGDRRVELKQGTTFAVSAGEQLIVQPRGEPVTLRVVQIAAR
jgi:hypothetical protein